MIRDSKRQLISVIALSATLLLVFLAGLPAKASAAAILVNNGTDVPLPFFCNLRQAIVSHNEKKSPFGSNCRAGTGSDEIFLQLADPESRTLDLGSPLNAIQNGKVEIFGSVNNCFNLRQAAYLRVDRGATLTLAGISVVVNGAEPQSVIENNGTLNIATHLGFGRYPSCLFSNQLGRDRKVSAGGILTNRGNATIDAKFDNSSAGIRGGAIFDQSGTVTITGGSFNGNNALEGGAIFVDQGASLKIASSNFSLSNNRADTWGGAIFSNGGIVSFERSSDPSDHLRSVSIASNKSPLGGAIYANGGQLSIDGMQFLGNSASANGGAIQLIDIAPSNPTSIARTYFRANSAPGRGASIYATGGSATVGSVLNLSGDTFSRDKGGIYVDNLEKLSVINSTFLGSGSAPEGIVVASGTGDVSFSTILLANLNGPAGEGFKLANSLLREVTCGTVADDGFNLQQQSSGCPNTINSELSLGLSTSFLQDNGGPTPTIALVSGSPAINQIPVGDCVDLSGKNPLTIDQRGYGRPFPAGGACDVGAYEFGASTAGPGIRGIPGGTKF